MTEQEINVKRRRHGYASARSKEIAERIADRTARLELTYEEHLSKGKIPLPRLAQIVLKEAQMLGSPYANAVGLEAALLSRAKRLLNHPDSPWQGEDHSIRVGIVQEGRHRKNPVMLCSVAFAQQIAESYILRHSRWRSFSGNWDAVRTTWNVRVLDALEPGE